MLVAARAEIVGIGGATLDLYRPVGQVGPDHTPGAKIGWTEQDQLMLDALLCDPNVDSHVGGNVTNALAWLALAGEHFSQVAFAGVLGMGDHASLAIRPHLEHLGIQNLAGEYPGYLPSVSIIERASGSDRMVRGRPRTNMAGYMDAAYIQRVTGGARLVLAASLKSADLTDTVFKHAPPDAFLALNPGSSEFLPAAKGGHPDQLLATMSRRKPNLLSLNDDELRQLFGAAEGAAVEPLAESATLFAESVLCTMGTAGMLLSRRLKRGGVEHTRLGITPITPVDTLGAGDRANAVTIYGLVMGHEPHKILVQAAEASAQVIRHVGAHGDLY